MRLHHRLSILIVAIFFLIAGISCQSSGCSDNCPADCEFGLKQIKSSDGSCKCVCAEDPCLLRICPDRTKCKLKTTRNCREGNCQSNLQPMCVPILKAGFCPTPDIIDESTSPACREDPDCEGTLKCCPSLTRDSCSKSCPVTKCRCPSGSVQRETFNRQGCPVCMCSKATNQTQDDVCSLARQYGDCQTDLARYYFDPNDNQCKLFTYSGCGGNANNFLTLEFCRRKCLPELFGHSNRKEISKCFKLNETGPCRGSFNRFFYNHRAQKCESFVYGGCEGNDNNFMSVDECDKACTMPISILSRNPVLKCTQPIEIGNCKGALPRFFYNQTSHRCEQFIYSGCKGNGNNFETMEDCSNVCNLESFRRLNLFKNHSNQHRSHHRHPKPSNRNTTTALTSAASSDKCSLNVDIGPCRATITRYFFNVTSQKCQQFSYGGCQGNANNFDQLEICQKECDPNFKIRQNKCQLPAETGPCRGALKKFFFNSQSNKCEPFLYGGCSGNANNFETTEECEKECSSSNTIKQPSQVKIDKCLQAAYTGPCRARFVRYFYNSTSAKCEEFVYGGCQKNENNFESPQECKLACEKSPSAVVEKQSNEKCSAAPEPGLCRGYMPNFFFNSTSQRCEQFIYGGCGGNENRYETIDECRKTCGGVVSNGGGASNIEIRVPARCTATPDSGMCLAYIPRFFFNTTSMKCEQFVYGGCGGNENKFDTIDECSQTCYTASLPTSPTTPTTTTKALRVVPAKCQSSVQPGKCFDFTWRFFFNSTSMKCQPFVYNGCEGNENNFGSMIECAKECGADEKATSDIDICFLPSETGVCRAIIEKYYYNSRTNVCEKFFYGGCGGNENKFETQEDCMKRCSPRPQLNLAEQNAKCKLDPETGHCRASMPRYFYNRTSQSCEIFVYGGCGGNANNFETVEECAKDCNPASFVPTPAPPLPPPPPQQQEQRPQDIPRCQQEKLTGPCRGSFTRFFYNLTSGMCEEFVYGGCQKNENNFESRQECTRACVVSGNGGVGGGNSESSTVISEKQTPEEKCNAAPETGLCRGYFPKFFYNSTSQRCEQFIYGGCGGNTNNYETIDECMTSCRQPKEVQVMAETTNKCLLPAESGMCFAYIPRFFFNSTSQRCEQFIYGGCGGNANSFGSPEECSRECPQLAPPSLPPAVIIRETNENCTAAPETGLCRGYFPKYFYNSTSQRCEQFIYGGCGGNGNNYETSDECMSRCDSSRTQQPPPTETRDTNENCTAAPETGLCRGYFPKFFYNSTSKRCEQFIYGGCGGNGNNYETSDECVRACARQGDEPDCSSAPESGECFAYIPRFFFNATSRTCHEFVYGGCGGNRNNYETSEQCTASCSRPATNTTVTTTIRSDQPQAGKCTLQPETGPCEALIRRYFYNATSRQCEHFTYGGCQGNENRFVTSEECYRECNNKSNINNNYRTNELEQEQRLFDKTVCSLAPELGVCKASIRKFFYNPLLKTCETFIYSGCGGNPNNFDTSEECLKSCGTSATTTNQRRKISHLSTGD